MTAFDRFAPFIREYIFSRGWQSLYPVQEEAARILFDTDDNLLLTSSTASGKTEAVFFPMLSELYEHPANSVAILYIAPLKSLINDQFGRIEELTADTGIPVTHWHGDVSRSHKEKLVRDPRGILQITPESLEAMLMRRGSDVIRLFSDLRYVVIDEIHTLTGADRGSQILCLLTRLARKIGHIPRRVGLSATVGDPQVVADWLGGGSGRATVYPVLPQEKLRWRLGLSHFWITTAVGGSAGEYLTPDSLYDRAMTAETLLAEDAEDGDGAEDEKSETPAELDPGYAYLYDASHDKKALIFSNSREETEYVAATMHQIAELRGDRDVYLIHHGNLSAAIREEAEMKMKDGEMLSVTCATVTMELGIDIGRLQRVLQMGSPCSVSSFLQRLGRSGRRGDPAEMIEIFREELPLPNTPLPQLIPWELLRGIAIIQLYREERFIEPPIFRRCPYSLLFQQTLSILSSSGSLTPARLADEVLSLPPFAAITREEYKELLQGMLVQDFIEMTEEKEFIVGLKGERLTASFKFFAVFQDAEDYTVRAGSDEVGTITTPPPVGERFALAGRVWEVTELDLPHKLVFVKRVKGKMKISWPGTTGEIHTKLLVRMRQVLTEDTEYPYLSADAQARLAQARAVARETGLTEHLFLPLGAYTWVCFPWLGTKSFRTWRKYLAQFAEEFRISQITYEGCCYITFRMERGTGEQLEEAIFARLREEGLDPAMLVGKNECPAFEKYDNFVPAGLLRRAYWTDKLNAKEILERMSNEQ